MTIAGLPIYIPTRTSSPAPLDGAPESAASTPTTPSPITIMTPASPCPTQGRGQPTEAGKLLTKTRQPQNLPLSKHGSAPP